MSISNTDTRFSAPFAFLVLAFFLLSSCSWKTHGDSATSSTQDIAVHPTRTLTLSAAASTKDLVTMLVDEFRKTTNISIQLNFGASSMLANQILSGAPSDLFLTASEQWADEVEKAGIVSSRVDLFTNRLVLVVPEKNAAQVASPQDLLKPSVTKIALAGENVPAGNYAGQALAKIQLMAPLMSQKKIVRGQDVRNVLAFVERGEADAGVVYATDVSVASGIKVVHEFDATLHSPIVYVLVRLKQPNANDGTQRFYEYMQSPMADVIGTRLGFIPIDRSHIAK